MIVPGVVRRARRVPQLEDQVADVRPVLSTARHAPVCEQPQLVEDVLACEVVGRERRAFAITEVDVRVDERGHHGLAGEVDMRGISRRTHVALALRPA